LSGGAPLIVSQETTIIIEPLKSDGKTVDFHKAIQKMTEPDIQANENGFRDVLLGYGREVFKSGGHQHGDIEQQYLLMCEALGIDPQTPPTMFLPTPEDANRQDVNKGLDAVRIAAAKPHYFVPLVRNSENDLVFVAQPHAVYAFHEELSDALRVRANARYTEKKIGEGWNDTLASLRLFRLATFNWAWHKTQYSTDDKADSMLLPVSEVLDTLPEWTLAQLTQGIKDLESLPNWQDRETMLKKLQFMLLDVLSTADDLTELVRRLNNGKLPAGFTPELLTPFQLIGFDMNLLAKELNGAIKAYGELMEQSADKSLDEQFEVLRLRQPGVRKRAEPLITQREMQNRLEDWMHENMSSNPVFTPGRSKFAGFIAGEMVTGAAGEMYRLQIIEESRCQALRLALALERYHREHQKYPDSLGELALPPMSWNVHLQYEKHGDGYRLGNKVFRLEK
jgi:hypothetical protein